ncbi:hypothetical protein B0H11DRAFT_1918038 [Mycena galericulata]|nr:hypothetical protein B0H11DRAFT_1918038 [Mycena galericulata]
MPIFHMRGGTTGYIQTLRLHHNKPLPVGEEPSSGESFFFREIARSDAIFDSIETQFPKLHTRSSEWDNAAVPLWKPLEDPHLVKLPDVYSMSTPLKLEKTPSPVNKKNRDTFTETQRENATGAPVAESFDDLQDQLNRLHAGGKTKPGQYVCISSDILDGGVRKGTGNEIKDIYLQRTEA